jgi:hypothetical protein
MHGGNKECVKIRLEKPYRKRRTPRYGCSCLISGIFNFTGWEKVRKVEEVIFRGVCNKHI